MSKRRAAVLIGVYVLFAIHLGLWFWSGMRDGVRETLSPVEPSESMYSLESGFLNAGFIFFVLAILSTFVFGRFFCGWGCHIVAVQDLCGWLMKKCGVHPKPFRSRLLVFVPLVVALYMFVWPTFKREVMFPLLSDNDPVVWNATWGVWLGETAKFPGWSDHLIVEDFWKTFAPWYVAIPFIFVCSFGVVYFLGNKGFCTYGCPYGGFFGPVDMVSIGHIKVNENCEGCGHCTAVCSSNVRVHEEVRDFGMVVDPGCMKCMDCVSVCPNEALSFGFAKPSVFTKPKPEAELRRATKTKNYDLTWPQEIFLALVFLGLTMGFRGMLNQVPLLMALGMAGIGTFFAWKLLQMVAEKSTRIHRFQLKFKGRLRPAGAAFAALALITLASGAWAGAVKWSKWHAEQIAATLAVPADQILSDPKFVVDAGSRETARRALASFERAGSWRDAGWGWAHTPDQLQTIAYLQLVVGDVKGTERTLMEIMSRGKPLDTLVIQLGGVMHLRGATEAEVFTRYEEILKKQPQLSQIRWMLAGHFIDAKQAPGAVRLYEDAVKARPGDPIVRKDFGLRLVLQLKQRERGMELIEEAVRIARGETKGMRVREDPTALEQIALAYDNGLGRPDLAIPQFEYLAKMKRPKRPGDVLENLAFARFRANQKDLAIETMKQAATESPQNPNLLANIAAMYQQMGRDADATIWNQKAQALAQELQAQQAKRAAKIRAWRGE